MGIIPASILKELVAALGAALLVGNLAVVVRERRRSPGDTGPRPNKRLVAMNLVLGAVLTLWGVGSLLASLASR
jgi:hypothetical protein